MIHVYSDLFNRAPDPAGLTAWTGKRPPGPSSTSISTRFPWSVCRTVPVIRAVTNATSAPSIFSYCLNTDYQAASCTSGTTAASAQVVRVTLDVARRGVRKAGLSGTFRLDDAVDLKNINRDVAP